ncbi:unnamed protein product [Moneuplotes crassus]|uniref:Phospholipid/glycerol acyltransferase domain-containing protein n=1 Tax=Euplotes crassus TaxID=5936 RepID=A0AAD1XHY5_EUPCR|nr:unnamed protein product [Moneuplotes crassus]
MGVFILVAVGGYLAKGVIFTKTFAIYFLIQSLLSFLLGQIIWKKIEKLKQNHMTDKYKEFRRTDTHLWSKGRFIFGVTFLFPFRLIAMTVVVSIYLFLIVVLTIGHDQSKPLKGIKGFLYRLTNRIFPRLALLAAGYFRMGYTKKEDYDYSKWLGKDYKNTQESKRDYAVSSTSNHSAWTDLFIVLIIQRGASFVSKEEIKSVPLFGRVGKALNTIFFERGSSKENKEKVLSQIQERQKETDENKGEGLILHIFGEGFTTNNSHILPFKKGVFSLGLPVKPIAIKYSSAYFSPAHDIIPMGLHFIFLLSQISNYCEATELPIFEPNEYLYKNHLKPGEEKWVPFSRAVRESIAETLQLPTSEATLSEKLACKDQYLGKAKAD